MARSTRANGGSITETEARDERLRGNQFPVHVTRPQLGLVDQPEGGAKSAKPTDGIRSTRSSGSESASSVKRNPSLPKPAPTMDSPSSVTAPETGDVISTGGNGLEMLPQPSDDERVRARVIGDEEFDLS